MQANRTESNEIEIKITFGMCVRCHGAIEPSSSGAIGHWILPSSSWQLCKHISLGKTRPGIRCTATFICLFSISTAQIEICVSGGYIVAAKVSLSLMTTSVFDGSWP